MTQPAGLESLNSGTGTALFGRGQLGSIWGKKSRPQPFSFLAVLILCRIMGYSISSPSRILLVLTMRRPGQWLMNNESIWYYCVCWNSKCFMFSIYLVLAERCSPATWPHCCWNTVHSWGRRRCGRSLIRQGGLCSPLVGVSICLVLIHAYRHSIWNRKGF